MTLSEVFITIGAALALAQFGWAIYSWRVAQGPQVIVDFAVVYGGAGKQSYLELHIRNDGKSAASDVRIRIDPPISGPRVEESFAETCEILAQHGIGLLPPGRTVRYHVAPPGTPGELSVDVSRPHVVTIIYRLPLWRFQRVVTRTHVPIVDGAINRNGNTVWVAPALSTSTRSIWVAPASIAAISVQILRPGRNEPVRTHRLARRSRPSRVINVAVTIMPALAI